MLSNRDKQLKAERGYHGKSFVRPDGSECLLDKRDWDLRKRELWQRAGGRCEYWKGKWGAENHDRCTNEGVYPDHVIPRFPVRDDRLTNLKLGCKECSKANERQNWRKTRFGEGGKPVCKRTKRSA